MFSRKIGDYAFSAEAADAGVLLAAKSHIGLINCEKIRDIGSSSRRSRRAARSGQR